MEYVIVLIANPLRPVINDNMTAVVAQALKTLTDGALLPKVEWLAPGVACEFSCYLTHPQWAEKVVRSAIPGSLVDICCLPRRGRRKRLLLADMDSTIIPFETIDEVAAKMGTKIGTKIAQITKRAMAGDMDYQTAYRQRTKLLEGAPAVLLDRVRDRIDYTNGAHELVTTMRASGAVCALVTSGFELFADHVADVLGFDHAWGNQIEVVKDHITGRVIDPIRDGSAKLETLVSLRQKYDISDEETMAVGDGANDVEMIANAGLGIAYRAKQIVAQSAHAHINHADLTALLYLQGYRLDEICH